MKLSLVVTTWGVERWADACLESVRRAAEGFDVEVLVISNGAGVAVARNEGLEKATGDYIWFVDGDDVIRRDSVERIVEAICTMPGVDIVRFDLRPFPAEGTFDEGDSSAGTKAVERFDLTSRSELSAAYRKYARWLLASSAVYRRELVKDMRFEDLVKGEDSLWGRRAFYAARSLVAIPAALYGYRRRSSGADQTRDARHYEDAKRVGWLMLAEGLRVPGIRCRVIFDWLRYRFRELPKWYNLAVG